MGKTGKNSNYQTEKRLAAKAAAERKERRSKLLKLLLAIFIPVVVLITIIAIIITSIGADNGWFRDPNAVTHYVTFIFDRYDGLIDDKGYPINAEVTMELYGEEAPETVENFVKLCKEGYYDGAVFHRLVEGFVAQGGDGDGNPDGINTDKPSIKGEFLANGYVNRISHVKGTVSMARRANDKNSASTQFFVVLETSTKNSQSLDGKYASFGKVIKGMDFFTFVAKGKNTDRASISEDEMPKVLTVMIETPEQYEKRTATVDTTK
jgi:cyclophilin family peptidyl-prolyl cis-trans isomerase